MPLDAINSLGSAGVAPGGPPLHDSARSASRPAPQEVKKAAAQFEAILVRQLLAPAIEPMMNGSLGGSSNSGGGVYGYMLTDVLANSVSQGGGLGLARIIESQLSPRAGSRPALDRHE